MKKCISCGKELEDNAVICTQCGAKLGDMVEEKIAEGSKSITHNEEVNKPQAQPQVAPVAQNIQRPQAQLQPQSQPVPPQQRPPQQRPMQQNQQPVQRVQQPMQQPQQPVQQPQPEQAPVKPISTAGFFLTMLLFAIPVIGWIACIIMGFTAKNSNRRSFARANLIWLAIFLLLAVAAVVWYFGWGKESLNLNFSFENTTFSL